MNYLLVAVMSMIGGWLGSYLGAYLKKKGENLATHEDLNRLVEQMMAITQATKTIESNISDKSWDRQRQWELKRDAVFSVMQALGKADEALHFVSITVVAERDNPAKFGKITDDAWDKFYTAIEDFDQKRALAMIICGKQMNDALISLKSILRDIGFRLGNGEVNSYQNSETKLSPGFARAFASARRELGIVREDKSKSLEPTPKNKVHETLSDNSTIIQKARENPE